MAQSLSNAMLHTVFSTKNRERFFQDSDLRSEVHQYLGGIAKSIECEPLIIGGTCDHVHLLNSLSRTVSIADMLKELKRGCSSWLRTEKGYEVFEWQSGYGTFSVSQSQVSIIKEYIENQENHHQRMTFKEEYLMLLEKHGVEYDERYVFE